MTVPGAIDGDVRADVEGLRAAAINSLMFCRDVHAGHREGTTGLTALMLTQNPLDWVKSMLSSSIQVPISLISAD